MGQSREWQHRCRDRSLWRTRAVPPPIPGRVGVGAGGMEVLHGRNAVYELGGTAQIGEDGGHPQDWRAHLSGAVGQIEPFPLCLGGTTGPRISISNEREPEARG
jgi:hypothetical protein